MYPPQENQKDIYEIEIGTLVITRASRGKTPISLLEAEKMFQNSSPISARDLIYAQNHINSPRVISKRDRTKVAIKLSKETPLNHSIMIKETVIVTPYNNYSYIFTRGSFLVEELQKILTTNTRERELYLLEEREYIKKAEKEQQKPLEERALFILNNPASIIPLIINRESTDLAKWLFQDQLKSLHACLEKHQETQFLFYGVEQRDRDPHHSFVRFLWLSPTNDERDPPRKDRASIGSYRLGHDYFYTAHKK